MSEKLKQSLGSFLFFFLNKSDLLSPFWEHKFKFRAGKLETVSSSDFSVSVSRKTNTKHSNTLKRDAFVWTEWEMNGMTRNAMTVH